MSTNTTTRNKNNLNWFDVEGRSISGLRAAKTIKTIATSNATAISTQIQSGSYCLIVYDYIGQTVTANYSLTVSHP